MTREPERRAGGGLAFVRQAVKCAATGRAPTRRALAALAKLNGARLERRWPFFIKAPPAELNLDLADVLEFQRWRSRNPTVLVVGAFDGVTNDPTCQFIRANHCRAILVEPQPIPFQRLRRAYEGADRISLVNAAVDERAGFRELYSIAEFESDMPDWAQQIASFDQNHVLKHEDQAPGLGDHVIAIQVPTVTFEELIDAYQLTFIDVLQIDAEGMDALLLECFPFERLRPGVVHYETVHIPEKKALRVQRRLASFGYRFAPIVSASDATAVAL